MTMRPGPSHGSDLEGKDGIKVVSAGELIFRLADPLTDQSKLDSLFAEMLRYFSTQPAVGVKPGQIANILASHRSCEVVLAERNGTAVGFASISFIFPTADLELLLYLRAIFVVQGARSEGVGAELMREVARIAAARDCARIDWATDITNTAAQSFYELLGATRMTKVVSYKLEGDAFQKLAQK